MAGPEVIAGYHDDLWQVEKSFQIAKTDRPAFRHSHDLVEVHLTIVSAGLPISRHL